MAKSAKCAAQALAIASLALVSALPCVAVELKKETVAAFDKYVKGSEARMANELLPGGAFLYPDSFPRESRDRMYEELGRGQILVSRLETMTQGKRIPIPQGMVHHWIGIAFIPNTTLSTVLRLAQDYGHRTEVYKPDVIASKLIWHNGNDYEIFLRLSQKKFTTVVLNTEYRIHWGETDAKHAYSNSYSTKIAEVKDPSNPNGPELPVGDDHGYLWRLYTYWRFAEKDGGVYMESQAISLTRDIPFGLGWLIRPLITSIPKQSLDRILAQTRAAVVRMREAPADNTLLRGLAPLPRLP